MSNVMESICAYFDVEDEVELFKSDSFNQTVLSSVQPSFCVQCGNEGPNLEPDGCCRCEACDYPDACKGLELIILGFV